MTLPAVKDRDQNNNQTTSMRLKTLIDTKTFALTLVKKLPKPPIIGLIGPLGAGKTTLVKYIIKFLSNQTKATSPTFVWLKTYPISKQGFKRLHHVDCYRINKPDPELINTINMCQQDKKAITIIEWANRIRPWLYPKTTILNIKINPDKSRSLTRSKLKN
ncbi:tRNA (adenosine(37)-N6)-threonylcarbamoyltransferase complex ATPase subunit type 1 TsaE [Patescibacteria group bacterium]